MKLKITRLALKILLYIRECVEKIKYKLQGIKAPGGNNLKWVKEHITPIFDFKMALIHAAVSLAIWVMQFGTLVLEFSGISVYESRIKAGFGFYLISLLIYEGAFLFIIPLLNSKISRDRNRYFAAAGVMAGTLVINLLVYIILRMGAGGEALQALSYAGYYTAVMFVLWVAGYWLQNNIVWILFPLVPIVLDMPPQVPGIECFAFMAASMVMILLYRQAARVKGTTFKDVGIRALLAGVVVAFSLIFSANALNRPAWSIASDRQIYMASKLFVENRIVGVWEDIIFRMFHDNRAVVDENPPEFYDDYVCIIKSKEPVVGNIYQKSIIGSYYENGLWKYDTREFKEACKDAELKSKQVKKEIENHVYDILKKSDKEEAVLSLKIQYQKVRGRGALVPSGTYIKSGKKLFSDAYVQKGVFDFNARYKIANTRGYSVSNWNKFIDEASETDAIWDFYDAYVRGHYMTKSVSVPSAKETAEMLRIPFYGGNSEGINRWRYRMAEKVGNYLVSGDYTYDFPELNGTVDATEYFLTHGMQGTAEHFATAGVLILRELGIPARYVEGYVVNGLGFEQKKNGTYQTIVLDRDRHSWVEIYLNHVGWVTVEMTPSYRVSDDKVITGQETKYLRLRPEYLEAASDDTMQITVADGEGVIDGVSEEYQSDEEHIDDDIIEQPEPEPENIDETDEARSPETADEPEDELASGEQEGPDAPELDIADIIEEGNDIQNDNSDYMIEDNSEQTEMSWHDILIIVGMVVLIILLGLLTIIVIAAVVGAIITALKLAIKKSRSKVDCLVEAGEYRKAILLINRRVYRNVRLSGKLLMRHPTDADFEMAMKETIRDISNQFLEQYMEVVKKAGFADESIELDSEECYIAQFVYSQSGLFKNPYWSRLYLIEGYYRLRKKITKKRG